MIRKIILASAVCLIASSSIVLGADAENESAAVEAAKAWLTLADEGRYSESWQEAAGYFRNAVSREQWKQAMQAVRKPLGKLVSRKVGSITFKTSLPGAPDGEYVMIVFETSFENKKAAVETVTPMKDAEGKWRVSGYFIK